MIFRFCIILEGTYWNVIAWFNRLRLPPNLGFLMVLRFIVGPWDRKNCLSVCKSP